jgi:hypothetical protein
MDRPAWRICGGTEAETGLPHQKPSRRIHGGRRAAEEVQDRN